MNHSAMQVKERVKVYDPRSRPPVGALERMILAVHGGQIFGLLGPNGDDKTILLKILTTLPRSTSGRAEVLGYETDLMDLLRFSSIGLGNFWGILADVAAFVVFSRTAFLYPVRCLQRD